MEETISVEKLNKSILFYWIENIVLHDFTINDIITIVLVS